jgi:hypothetical protein
VAILFYKDLALATAEGREAFVTWCLFRAFAVLGMEVTSIADHIAYTSFHREDAVTAKGIDEGAVATVHREFALVTGHANASCGFKV